MTIFDVLGSAAYIEIPLKGTEDYAASIIMDIPIQVNDISAGFDTEHVHQANLKGSGTTISVLMKSYEAGEAHRPSESIGSIKYRYHENRRLGSVGRSPGLQ